MSGFGFGGANSSTSGSPFLTGTNQNTASTGFSLGGGTAAPNPLFGGTPAQSTGFSGFGAPASTGLSFGATPAQTNTGALSFGAPTLGQTQGISFGAPATSASTGLFGSSFGAPASQPSSLSFGAPTVQTSSLTFGQVVPAQPAPAFGVTPASQGQPTFGQPATSTGFGFGSAAPQTSGISFGALPASTAPTSLSFGTNTASVAPLVKATTASTGFSFGAPAQLAAPTGLSLGLANPTTSTAGLSFGATTSTAGLGFGSAASTTTSLGFQGLTTTTTAAKPLSLFGAAATTTTPGLGLSLGTPTTSAPGFGSLGQGTGLFGAAKPLTLGTAPTGTVISFGTTPTSTNATTASIGLGGIDTTVNKVGQAGSGIGARAEKAVKENQIPNEITQTIDGFKAFVKSQKSFSSDVARGSTKPLDKVCADTEALQKVLSGISSGFQRNRVQADRLKTDTAAAIRNSEMAQRTHDTPPGLQLDNVAPLLFFNDLAALFENEMHMIRQEIENTEKHIGSLTEPRTLSPQELSLAMRRLHDSFVALAGRLQSVHNSVELQKDQYMNLRKYFLKDTASVFEDVRKPVTLIGRRSTPNRISLGPTPFSSLGNEGYGTPTTLATEAKSTYLSFNSSGWGSGPQQTNLSSSFLSTGNNPLSMTLPSTQENQNFLLQKPPPGTKRGKH